MSVERKRVVGEAALVDVAQELVELVAEGGVVCLTGELGAGKTTLVQQVARQLGISEVVGSPTFTIVAEYEVVGHPSLRRLVHVDLYRLEGEAVERESALSEVLEQASEAGQLTMIEWADRLGALAPEGVWWVSLEHGTTATERIVRMERR